MIIKTKFEGYAKDGTRLYPFDKGSSAPPAPDPTQVSAAQTQSNLDTSRANARINRVNQFTPYGNLTYTQKQPGTFDQAGYDAAMQAYNASRQGTPASTTSGMAGYGAEGGEYSATTPGTTGQQGQAPTREQFMSPGSDEWEARITLTPEQQALLDQDNRIKSQLGAAAESGIARVTNAMGQPFDTSQMAAFREVPQGGGAPTPGGAESYNPAAANYTRNIQGGNIQTRLPNSDYGAQRTSVEEAILSRVNPQLQRDRQMLDQRLANQGIMPGSEAYNTAIDEANRAAVDARYQAVLAGGQEQSRLAGLDLQAGQFANQAQQQGFAQGATNAALNNSVNDTQFNQGLSAINQRNQANQQNYAQGLASNNQNFQQQLAASQMTAQQRQQQMQEQAYLRSLPLNELNALRSGAQVQNPNFSPTPQTNVAGTNVSGDIWNSYNANVANSNAQQAGNNAFMSGLFGLGSAALGAPADGFLSELFG